MRELIVFMMRMMVLVAEAPSRSPPYQTAARARILAIANLSAFGQVGLPETAIPEERSFRRDAETSTRDAALALTLRVAFIISKGAPLLQILS